MHSFAVAVVTGEVLPGLPERLRAALDGIERIATAAMTRWPEPWRVEPRYDLKIGCRCMSCTEPDEDVAQVWPVEDVDGADVFFPVDIARHIAEHDPAHVLRTIQAHRKIIDEFDTLANDRRRLTDAAMHLQFSVMGRVVRDLASIYFPEES